MDNTTERILQDLTNGGGTLFNYNWGWVGAANTADVRTSLTKTLEVIDGKVSWRFYEREAAPSAAMVDVIIWSNDPNYVPTDADYLNLVPPSLDGDLNLDGFVGQDDLNIILGAWGQNVTQGDPMAGDPSNDGFVGQDDLNFVLGDWGQGTPPPLSAVPEPQSLLLGLIGAVGYLVFRRRQIGRFS